MEKINARMPKFISKAMHSRPLYRIRRETQSARIVECKCPAEMIILVSADRSNAASQKALLVLCNPHNHPAHPKSKPSANYRRTLSKAVEATGVLGLTVQHLLNASSTPLICERERVAAVAPAFMDHRRVRDLIDEQKEKEYPRGMGWDAIGVLYHLSMKEPSLLKSERYIHTAMSKNGFRLVVTMHPQIALYIHHTLALNIDFTFKHVEVLNRLTDPTEQFQHSVITDNDFGLNSFNPSTGEFLNFLDDEFLSHLEMDTVGSYSVADLPPFPH
ncbi:hypothetical protein K438DRAFT_2100248 [Mycena galopus ATCC 62051]|nr:hypothetical protein K438DRAFT_2100248 [Mycena galopus ATCC 62051]